MLGDLRKHYLKIKMKKMKEAEHQMKRKEDITDNKYRLCKKTAGRERHRERDTERER